MDTLITQAMQGQIATVNQIKEAYAKRIGKSVRKASIYRLLERTS
ncbi:MAG TPA: hypothetical protein PLE30_09985 [Candidatus Kapabacteria bacterium]|nr:hypothetical protein [Candidatus Kapabacteria bacterium]